MMPRSIIPTTHSIDERQGRMIRIGDHWLADFASSSYLGLDVDKEISDAVYEEHSGAELCKEIEHKLIELLGCEDALVMPTIADTRASAMSLLAGRRSTTLV